MPYNYEPLTRLITNQDIAEYKKRDSNSWQGYTILQWIGLISGGLLIVTPISMLFFSGIFMAFRSGSIVLAIGLFMLLISFLIIVFAIYYLYTRHKIKYDIKLHRFAEANNLVYKPWVSGIDLNYPGMIFNISSRHAYKERLNSLSGLLFEISNYSYTVGSGKNQQTIEKGYIMIKLDRNLPNIVLDSNKNNFKLLGINISNLPVSFKNNQKLALEGDFDNYFSLYVPVGYERDALYIFTPDLMALFIDNSSVFDAEIIDDKLFIYSNRFDLSKPATLGRILQIIETVGNKTLSQTDAYADTRVDSQAINVVSADGSRLKRRMVPLSVIIFVIIVILFIIF